MNDEDFENLENEDHVSEDNDQNVSSLKEWFSKHEDLIGNIVSIIFWGCIIFSDYICEWIEYNLGKKAQTVFITTLCLIFIISLICHVSPYSINKTPLENFISLLGLLGLIAFGILLLKIYG